MAENKDPFLKADAEAITLAKTLLRDASYAAIAVNEPETGFPLASRVLLAADSDGTPIILVSALASHTRAIERDQRVSLLTGEPGKGDPLAHARMTTRCIAGRVPRDSAAHQALRAIFLARHPKARLYIDFPDFSLFRLTPVSADLNGGFGRAYRIDGQSLIDPA